MHNKIMQNLKFNRWHERQLYQSFAWLVSCLLCGLLFAAVVELIGHNYSGIFSIISLVVLYGIGLAAIELYRRFWMQFAFAQQCASSATCQKCDSYGLFKVRIDAWPIYARCRKCDHQWVIGQKEK